jgi:hypothetical protein
MKEKYITKQASEVIGEQRMKLLEDILQQQLEKN